MLLLFLLLLFLLDFTLKAVDFTLSLECGS